MRFLLLLALLLACIHGQTSDSPIVGGLTIIVPGNSPWGNATHVGPYGGVNAPTYVWGGPRSYDVTAQMTFATPFTNGCLFTNTARFRNRIVLFSTGGFCSHAFKVKQIQDAGGVGAVFTEVSEVPPSFDSMAVDFDYQNNLTIPFNFVAMTPGFYLFGQLLQNRTVVVRLTYQPDPFKQFTETQVWTFLNFLYGFWFGCIFALASFKLVLFIREQGGIKFTVPQVCLSTTALTALLMILTCTMDVHGSRGIVGYLTMVVFREFIVNMFLIPVMVFPFYWGELIHSTQPVTGLKESRIPFFIACFIIEGFTFSMAIVRGLYGSSRDAIWAMLCTIIILSGLAAFWFVIQGVRVIIALGRMQESYLSTPMQKRITFLFISLGLVIFGWPITYAVGFSSAIRYMTNQFWGWWSFYWVVPGLSLSLIAVMMTPRVWKEKTTDIRSKVMSGMSRGAESRGVDKSGLSQMDSIRDDESSAKHADSPN